MRRTLRMAMLLLVMCASILMEVAYLGDDIVDINGADQTALEKTACEAQKQGDLRTWKRCEAILRLAREPDVMSVAADLDCGISSVYQWAAAWRRDGIDGIKKHDPQRPSQYKAGRKKRKKLQEILRLYNQGMKWSAIAARTGYKTAAGPWRLAKRALEAR